MSVDPTKRLQVLFVWTRPDPGLSASGRDGFIRKLREAVSDENQTVDHYVIGRVHHVTGVRKILSLVFVVTQAIFNGRAIQEVLFSSKREEKRLLESIREVNPDVIYFDTVRCASLVRAVKKYGNNARLLVDFDDLMSRRYYEHVAHVSRQGLQFGYLEKIIGHKLSRVLNRLPISGWVVKREALALERTEVELVSIVDQIILASPTEATILESRIHAGRGSVSFIPQSFRTISPVKTPVTPYRFIFIGSDAQLQNALVIDYLLRIWKDFRPHASLVIFGRQRRYYSAVEHVEFSGYEPEFERIYTNTSIVLVPAKLAGGIKTKVLEALAYGVPVVTNEMAVEGLPEQIAHLEMVVTETQLCDIITHPESYIDRLTASCEQARAILSENWGPDAYRQKLYGAILGQGLNR